MVKQLTKLTFLAVSFLVCTNDSFAQDSVVDRLDLLKHACTFSSPCFGIAAYSHCYEAPYLVLRVNPDESEFKGLLNLSPEQIVSGKKLNEINDLIDDGEIQFPNIDHIVSLDETSDIYSFLNQEQKWTMELLRLRTEGFSALRRPGIAKEIGLDDQEKKAISDLIRRYRKEFIAPNFRRTFAGGKEYDGVDRFSEWYYVKITCQLNIEILDVLNEKQKIRLVDLVSQSENLEPLSYRAFQIWLGDIEDEEGNRETKPARQNRHDKTGTTKPGPPKPGPPKRGGTPKRAPPV